MVLAGVNDREQTTLWCGSIPREFVADDLDQAAAKMRQLFEPFGRVATVTARKPRGEAGRCDLHKFCSHREGNAGGRSVPSDDSKTCELQLKKADLNVKSSGAASKSSASTSRCRRGGRAWHPERCQPHVQGVTTMNLEQWHCIHAYRRPLSWSGRAGQLERSASPWLSSVSPWIRHA